MKESCDEEHTDCQLPPSFRTVNPSLVNLPNFESFLHYFQACQAVCPTSWTNRSINTDNTHNHRIRARVPVKVRVRDISHCIVLNNNHSNNNSSSNNNNNNSSSNNSNSNS